MINFNKSASIKPNKLPISAWLGHIPFAAWLVEELHPTLLVELGTHHGASYLGFCQAISELALSTRCYAVDTWEGDEHAKYYEGSVYEQLRSYHDEKYDDFSKLLKCTFDEALHKFSDNSVDLLHIDGLHTYEAVKHDYESWFSKLSDRAVVLFHDLEERQGDFGVWRLWDELSKKYPSFSFTHSHGLGVLLVGEAVPESVVALTRLDPVQIAVVSNIFAALGRGVQAAYDRDWWRKEAEGYGVKLLQTEGRINALQEEISQYEELIQVERNSVQKQLNEFSVLKQQYELISAELKKVQSEQQCELQEKDAYDVNGLSRSGEVEAQKLQIEIRDVPAVLETSSVGHSFEDNGHLANNGKDDSITASATDHHFISEQEKKLSEDIRDRDELIANLAKDLHHARESLSTNGARLSRVINNICQRYTSEKSIVGRLVNRAFIHYDKRRGRPNLVQGELLNSPAGPAGTPTHAFPPEFAQCINAREPSDAILTRQSELSKSFSYQPLISFIIPIYRLPREILEHTLLSIEAQTYSNWEACLAWADLDDLDGWRWLEKRCAGERRLRAILLDANGGISENSNAALAHAEGEFVALLDHDDIITPWALFDMVNSMQEDNLEVDFLYSDKDSIDAAGNCRMNALFKPQWSPEMLHSVNYLTHFNLMRTSIVRKVGAWDKETDGAQDWDIFFRVTSAARKIKHVPSIHYHWRILPTSTASGLQTKPYAIMGQLRTQKNYFSRQGLPAQVKRTDQGLFHVSWPIIPMISEVIVIQRGSFQELVHTLNLLLVSDLSSVKRIHIVHSGEPSPELNAFVMLPDCKFVLFRQDEFSLKAVSQCLDTQSKGVVIIDGRAVGLSEGLVNELLGWVHHHPDIAWTTALAVDLEGKVVEAGRVVSGDGDSAPLFHGAHPNEFGWFGGAQWYRNVSTASPYAIAFKMNCFQATLHSIAENEGIDKVFQAACVSNIKSGVGRGLVNPFAVVYMNRDVQPVWNNDGDRYQDDPYFNPAFRQVSPLRLMK